MDFLAEQPFAVLTSELQDVQDGSLLHVAQARRSAHAVAFYKAVEDSANCFLREPHVGPERLLARLRVSLAALLTLPPLDVVASFTSFDRFDFA